MILGSMPKTGIIVHAPRGPLGERSIGGGSDREGSDRGGSAREGSDRGGSDREGFARGGSAPGSAPDQGSEPGEGSLGASAMAPGALRDLSARLGTDLLLVQGPGGNTSLKLGDQLWIKASGTNLADARTEPIFLCLDAEEVRRLCLGKDEPRWEGLGGLAGGRPSIETPLHVLLPQAIVLHVHSVSAMAWAVQRDGHSLLQPLLKGLPWAWVPYRRPGSALTRAVADVMSERGQVPDVLVLGNHGLVVAGATPEEVETLLGEVEARLGVPTRPELSSPTSALVRWADATGWALPQDPVAHSLALDPSSLEVVRQGPLFPDQVVFLGPLLPEVLVEGTASDALVSEDRVSGKSDGRAVSGSQRDSEMAARALLVPGHGVVVHREISAAAEATLGALARLALRIYDPSAIRGLSSDEVSELLGWDAERYRQTLSTAADSGGDLAGVPTQGPAVSRDSG